MKYILPELIILSAELQTLIPQENDLRTNKLEKILKDLGLKPHRTLGRFNGVDEKSFCVVVNHELGFTPEFFSELAYKSFDQECILFRNKDKQGFLMGVDETGTDFVQSIGKIDTISEQKALDQDSYTYFATIGAYLGKV